eukprot:c52890_g1_i1.p1 GENE.c52890_g1_i1~~c52890_g1_i1.p1  ORF type:complete len:436 (-),score=99.20 c52890_g1_i1:85-1335(-)
MFGMDEAAAVVLQQAAPLQTIEVEICDALNHVLAQDVVANEPVPAFRASIMDGYAVVSSDGRGEYSVVGSSVAGTDPESILVEPGTIAYVTTGAPVPSGADAVIPVEKTEEISSTRVRIDGDAKPGLWIREIGSDCEAGTVVAAKGECLHAAEVGLCAMVGVTRVRVTAKPIIAVMSTGDEIVPPETQNPQSGKVRDSNRPMLLAAFESLGYRTIDLGIAPDTREGLKDKIYEALECADMLVTSGGVSMGKLDLLKPLLEEIGTIHFGRINMKPGKPTTFATVQGNVCNDQNEEIEKKLLVFALPGNPVSTHVTFNLLVVPALRAMQGFANACLPFVQAAITSEIRLDPERPEYHRVVLTWSDEGHCYHAVSTGFQRSSRLLSLRSANGLLVLPAQPGTLQPGTLVKALILPGTFL